MPRTYNSSPPVYLDCRPAYSPTVVDKAAKSHKPDKSVECNNGSGDVGSLRRSERISSRAPSVEPSALGVQVGPRGRSAARSDASSGCATPQTPTEWNSPITPRSTDEVLLQALRHLQRNSDSFTRGDSLEPEDLEAYRTLDPSRGGSPTNDDDIITAGEGQAPFRGRSAERILACALGWIPQEARNGSEMKKARDTRLRSRSSSRAPEARNGSDFSKAQTKKAKLEGHREIQQAFLCVWSQS